MWSTYIRNKVLDKILKGTDFSLSVYVSAHTATPGITGANEVAGGSYARQLALAAVFDAASGAESEVNASITFTGMPSTTVTHWGIWDAVSGGNFIVGGPLDASVVVPSGDGFAIEIGALVTLEAGSV